MDLGSKDAELFDIALELFDQAYKTKNLDVEKLNKAAEIYSNIDHHIAKNNLGLIYIKLHNYEKAIEVLEKITDTNILSNLYLGDLYIRIPQVLNNSKGLYYYKNALKMIDDDIKKDHNLDRQNIEQVIKILEQYFITKTNFEKYLLEQQ